MNQDVREFVSIVSRINSAFIACKPSYLRLLSFWEKLPSRASTSSADSHKSLVSILICLFTNSGMLLILYSHRSSLSNAGKKNFRAIQTIS